MIRGRIVTFKDTYAFALGADGVQYFVIPSCMAVDTIFDDLAIGREVMFIPLRDFPKGPRASLVSVNGVGNAELGEGE